MSTTAKCHPDRPHYAYGQCQSCYDKEHKETKTKNTYRWRKENPEKEKRSKRRAHLAAYGLTIAEYDQMLRRQKGRCWICKQPPGARRLAVDHCHKTGQVRGLLCAKCNSGLGQFRDSRKLLTRAARYLLRSGDPSEVLSH